MFNIFNQLLYKIILLFSISFDPPFIISDIFYMLYKICIGAYITSKIKKGYCVFFMTETAQGDALIIFELINQLEKYYNTKIFMVMLPKFKAIAKLYGYKDEILYIKNINIIPQLDFIKEKYGPLDENWKKQIADKSPKIRKSDCFIWCGLLGNPQGNIWVEHMLSRHGIPTELLRHAGKANYNNYKSLVSKIKYNKTIMLCPESFYLREEIGYDLMSADYINKLARYFKDRGYNVIYNKIKKDPKIKEAKWIKGSVEKIIGAAIYCHRIVSVRSGLCDVLHGMGRKLIVVNSEKGLMEHFNINANFGGNVREYIFDEVCQNVEKFGELCLED